MAGSTGLVVVFEILPALRKGPDAAGSAARGPDAFLPTAGGEKLPDFDRLKEGLRTAKDLSPVGEEDEAHASLLEYVNGLGPGVLEAHARTVPYSFFSRVPADFRGTAVSITAHLLDWKAVALE